MGSRKGTYPVFPFTVPGLPRRLCPITAVSAAASDGGSEHPCAELRPEEPPGPATASGEDGPPDRSPRQYPRRTEEDPDDPVSGGGEGKVFSVLGGFKEAQYLLSMIIDCFRLQVRLKMRVFSFSLQCVFNMPSLTLTLNA